MHTPWLDLLEPLRPALRGQRDDHGHVGSLRWLERKLEERGANPHAVRNILYREIGTPEDKLALFGVLRELYGRAGLTPPEPPEGLEGAAQVRAARQVQHLLGRQKKRAYRQFLSGVRARRAPKLVVVGRGGVGKTILIEHLEAALREMGAPVRRLMLEGEIAPALTRTLELSGEGAESLARLHAGLPFAVQASIQAEVARLLRAGLEGGALLIRVGVGEGTVAGTPPRNAAGESVSLARWVWDHLFLPLQDSPVSVLLALSEAREIHPDYAGEVLTLKPPTLEEARRFLASRLPTPAAEADRLIRQSGRNLEQLALLAGLSSLSQGAKAADLGTVMKDPEARALLAALAAAIADDENSAPRFAVEGALGKPLSALPEVYRSLFEETSRGEVRVVSRDLLPEVRRLLVPAELASAHRRAANACAAALEEARVSGRTHEAAVHEERMLAHLARAGAWREVIDWVSRYGERYGVLADAWARARRQVHGEVLESLARVVAGYYAALGQYAHPDARDALSVLLESEDVGARAWARVKLAESAVDRAAYDAAQDLLGSGDVREVLAGAPGELAAAARAEATLVQAALARWNGDLAGATAHVERAVQHAEGADATLGARVRLWRGLIYKDRGEWTEALGDLSSVSERDPLLHARARYQEGDLRLRLGQPFAAAAALREAHHALEHAGAALEERARVAARYATALRRLGRLEQASAQIDEALRLAQGTDAVIRARVMSERVPIALALERFREGLRLALEAQRVLSSEDGRRQEAQYRAWRTSYRTGLAYVARGLGIPYLPPFPGPQRDHPDLMAARRILGALLEAAWPVVAQADRYAILATDVLLALAAAEPDAQMALEHAERALSMDGNAYAEAQVRATLADVCLRLGRPERALGEVNRAHALLRRAALGLGEARGDPQQGRPDPGVTAALISLEARALLAEGGEVDATLRWARAALEDPDLMGFRAPVMRELGKALEALPDPERARAALRAVFPELNAFELRWRDALELLV
ncbi:tetratricopeptide (TPR) repeat protein [Deinobacterium chartae]|uniref:Tetratricopeptide (TPR) repeat protein n=1 Tax=Deinobacterium chartae TaxID=521158 RepID=A0A841I8E2_9DEIO|nr:hypothetical protein [Deinobacterium chartae]MBB6100055.1 tetratricopeptide (TPR) repeat protein [Deinobacterium chartae]